MINEIQKNLYEEITEKGISKLKKLKLNSNYYEGKRARDYSTLSLFANINEETKNKIHKKVLNLVPEDVLKVLQKQKIHPADYLHINLFMFVYESESIEKQYISKVLKVCETVLSEYNSIDFKVKGIGVSDSTIFLKVYSNDVLELREKIKQELVKINLPYFEKYPQIGAHISFVRFNKEIPLDEINKIIDFIEQNKETEIENIFVFNASLIEKKYKNKIKTEKIYRI